MSAELLENALNSIAANTCCDRCREAALVAQEALAKQKEEKTHGDDGNRSTGGS
jgi:hypothetical protein